MTNSSIYSASRVAYFKRAKMNGRKERQQAEVEVESSDVVSNNTFYATKIG
jgi:hypothetical protein